ncbi:MAG: hypothetical protein ACJA07_000501 [Rhodococcus sp. (in: high G+C Gram-positive bacteria)]
MKYGGHPQRADVIANAVPPVTTHGNSQPTGTRPPVNGDGLRVTPRAGNRRFKSRDRSTIAHAATPDPSSSENDKHPARDKVDAPRSHILIVGGGSTDAEHFHIPDERWNRGVGAGEAGLEPMGDDRLELMVLLATPY